MSSTKYFIIALLSIFLISNLNAQEIKVKVSPEIKHQTIQGFGAALAFYENWLTAHPNKSEIYEAAYKDLSLDILRVRNAYDYDAGMVGRVKEFIDESEKIQGRPIPFLTTSWGPPAYLKSNNDRNNGGTLKYSIVNGEVVFDYDGFAEWWNSSLDEYASVGVNPTYISIQNEPDFKASYESCLLNPFEKVNATDTIAGYNKALEAVHAKIATRTQTPKILGPETIGIGYNSVKNYLLHTNTNLLYGVAHHLYHGVDHDNPFGANEMEEVGKLNPELPHFQTEFDRGDWFSLAGLMFNSLVEENAVAYFYWALAWDKNTGKGLILLENPWSKGSWKTSQGYEKPKDYYSFKQFSKFINPGWIRVETNVASSEVESAAFMSPNEDSLSIITINRSKLSEKQIRFDLADFTYYQSAIYTTSNDFNCMFDGELEDSTYTIQPQSVNTAFFTKSFKTNIQQHKLVQLQNTKVYPNPFTHSSTISHQINEASLLTISNIQGHIIDKISDANVFENNKILLSRNKLKAGLYFFKIENNQGQSANGRFMVSD